MSETLLPYQPSLASATNTRVDSACKHHHQCRVSTDNILELIHPKNDTRELERNKYRYCVHKDELVVAVGRPWSSTESRKKMNNAYPRVISSLGMLVSDADPNFKTHVKMICFMYHFCRSLREREIIVQWFSSTAPKHGGNDFFNDSDDTKAALSVMHDYMPMGYAQTLGWASPISGDTMTTVMIGGMRTVMNGDFEIRTGDELQWYWPFEVKCFRKDGSRKSFGNVIERNGNGFQVDNLSPYTDVLGGAPEFSLTREEQARKEYHSQVYGQPSNTPKVVARLKRFVEDYENPRMYDKERIFAVAMSSARPHEMVDIKICRQSL